MCCPPCSRTERAHTCRQPSYCFRSVEGVRYFTGHRGCPAIALPWPVVSPPPSLCSKQRLRHKTGPEASLSQEIGIEAMNDAKPQRPATQRSRVTNGKTLLAEGDMRGI